MTKHVQSLNDGKKFMHRICIIINMQHKMLPLVARQNLRTAVTDDC